ncbi:hypothetical protein U9M48_007368 [Paspalum notatum var. saurae]|uniref:Uncharacterized protein n=1 Tax=Paspalum notatum var. saurae TaxID=547442 RepID=A0AAQ3Q0E4_PASNO
MNNVPYQLYTITDSRLDIGEGREINPKEREDYKVVIEDGKFLYKKSGQILDTSCRPRDAKWFFVLSTSKNLYVGQALEQVNLLLRCSSNTATSRFALPLRQSFNTLASGSGCEASTPREAFQSPLQPGALAVAPAAGSGHDRAHKSFSRNKLVQDIVGTLGFMPLIF